MKKSIMIRSRMIEKEVQYIVITTIPEKDAKIFGVNFVRPLLYCNHSIKECGSTLLFRVDHPIHIGLIQNELT